MPHFSEDFRHCGHAEVVLAASKDFLVRSVLGDLCSVHLFDIHASPKDHQFSYQSLMDSIKANATTRNAESFVS
jgi:hypothetical protein